MDENETARDSFQASFPTRFAPLSWHFLRYDTEGDCCFSGVLIWQLTRLKSTYTVQPPVRLPKSGKGHELVFSLTFKIWKMLDPNTTNKKKKSRHGPTA